MRRLVSTMPDDHVGFRKCLQLCQKRRGTRNSCEQDPRTLSLHAFIASDLDRAINRLSLLQAHDALCLLKNSIAMPKLLYILRTSPCFGLSDRSAFATSITRRFVPAEELDCHG